MRIYFCENCGVMIDEIREPCENCHHKPVEGGEHIFGDFTDEHARALIKATYGE